MSDLFSTEAREFGQVVSDTVARHGGTDIVRRSEVDPTERVRVADALSVVGLWDLDPYADEIQLEAAAAACRAAGGTVIPYPVAERLAAARTRAADAIVHVDPRCPRLPHGGLDLQWLATTENRRAAVVAEGPPLGTRLGPFAVDIDVSEWTTMPDRTSLTMLLTLQAWTLLGMAEAAAQQTYTYVSERHQFGAPLSSFQGLRFALTDVEVQLEGLTEVARYTLWSLQTRREEVWADALALRLSALEATDVVFRTCHQSQGAMGLCDESDLSWLSRHSQPLRRLPWGRSQTEAALLAALQETPLAGPFAAA